VQINGSVVLVTGANRGLGRFVKASLSRDHELIYPPVQEFWDDAAGPG